MPNDWAWMHDIESAEEKQCYAAPLAAKRLTFTIIDNQLMYKMPSGFLSRAPFGWRTFAVIQFDHFAHELHHPSEKFGQLSLAWNGML